jgi:RimJ/RimL family protein N-acetyltransferase
MGVWNGVELDEVTITTARLTLRPWRPDDAGAVLAGVAGDRAMREFLPVPDPYTAADAAEFAGTIGNEGRADGTGFGVAIVETGSARVVGGAGIRLPILHRPDCEIGYSVYPPGRGHGYAAETADALARWAFGAGVPRVMLRCAVGNIASVKTALAAGFRYEGIRRGDHSIRSGLTDGAAFARLATDTGDRAAPYLAPLPPGGLRDDVLALRVIEADDAATLVEQYNDPVSMSWAFDDKRADEEMFGSRAAAAHLQWLVGPVGLLAIVELASGKMAGDMQLRSTGPPNVLGIGYGVGAAFRGNGYTTRALTLLMPWAFGPAGIARLELGAKVANVASQKAALNAGFVADGIRRARLRNPDATFSDEARFAAVNPNRAS